MLYLTDIFLKESLLHRIYTCILPERESRNVNALFYEMEGRQIQKMNKVLADVELTKAEEKTLIWLAGWEENTVDHLLSVIEKAARIRADQKGGYVHKYKRKSEK